MSQVTTPADARTDTENNQHDDEICSACGGTATHTETYEVNGWINAASAYDSHDYECEDCGRTGTIGKGGRRYGILAAPEPTTDELH